MSIASIEFREPELVEGRKKSTEKEEHRERTAQREGSTERE
jgi:hypothetical protein